MKIIGITGGVGSGKSAILDLLNEKCLCRIIKSDELAKSLELKGEVCYEPLVNLLGRNILDETSEEIVPSKMAAAIFAEDKEDLLAKVNGIIHPEVKKRILSLIEEEKSKGQVDYFFIEAALLIEERYDLICDELWYIYCDVDVRKERLRRSRGYSDEKINNIISSQLDDSVFRQFCKVTIDNSNSLEEASKQIDVILNK